MAIAPSSAHPGRRWRPGALLAGVALGALLAGAVFLIALSLGDEDARTGVEGSGVVATETRDLPPFTSVDLVGASEVRIGVGGEQLVSVRGDDNLLQRITTEVHDGTLVIADTGSFEATVPMTVEITVTSLDAATLSGSGFVVVDGHTLDALRVALPGSGLLRAVGTVDTLDVVLDGSGLVQLQELVAKDATVELSGSGTVHVHVTESLDATVSGSGAVLYSGHPAQVERSITGSGAIIGD